MQRGRGANRRRGHRGHHNHRGRGRPIARAADASASASSAGPSGSRMEKPISDADPVKISKKLCYLLRHGLGYLESKGRKVHKGGWVSLNAILSCAMFSRISQADVLHCVETSRSFRGDHAQRFQVEGVRGGGLFIRATYGHSFPVDLTTTWESVLPDLEAEAAKEQEGHPQDERIPALITMCLDCVCNNIKLYEGLGDCLDDALLRRILGILKQRNQTSRAVMDVILGEQLQTLDLEKVFVSDGTLRVLAKKCSSLRRLNLRGVFTACTDQSLAALLKSCKKIEALNIAQCKYVTDKGIDAISKNLKNSLEFLDISSLPRITDAGIKSLQSITTLKLVTATGCPYVTKSALDELEASGVDRGLRVESDHDDPVNYHKADDIPYGMFSDHAPYAVYIPPHNYQTLQHYFQSQKYVGTPHEELIRNADTPEMALKLGHDRHVPLRADWEQVKDEVMLNGLLAKFQQHPELKKVLLSTKNRPLIETARHSYWGIGADGKGRNRHGELLSIVRERLRGEGLAE